MTPLEVCAIKCEVAGRPPCITHDRTGLNPEFTGCSACHKFSESGESAESLRADMQAFMRLIRNVEVV